MSEKSINELNLNSITISNSNYSNSKGYTAQSNTLETNNAGVLLINGIPISGGGGGGGVDNIIGSDGIDAEQTSTGVFTITNTGILTLTEGTNITITGTNGNLTINSTGGGGIVNDVTGGTGISVTETPSGSGTFEIENVGVLSLTGGDGIDVDFNTGDINISSTVNPADYYTIANADATFQTQADMASYSTTTQANALYQPIGNYQTVAAMANYSTTTQANALYQPIGNYLTETTANNLYLQTNKIAIYKLEFNTVVLTANSIYQQQFTIPNFAAGPTSSIVMTSNALADDGVIYVCSIYWEGNDVGGATFLTRIANISNVDGANHLRDFSVIVINP